MNAPTRSLALLPVLGLLLSFTTSGHAHDLGHPGESHPHYDWSVQPPQAAAVPPWFLVQAELPASARVTKGPVNPAVPAAPRPPQATPFAVFAPKVGLRWDRDFLYVESNGMPAHNMMVGITNWQQQVPLPQAYFGDNAWRLPLHPVVAKQSASIKSRFLRGAIALAANGIPIFNPQNNRGEVSQEIGELDQWGGHCGRADDYHYHAAPLHLQATVGKGQPIAYALDGFPIYGLTEPDGSPLGKLDECNGHHDSKLGYHYHASTKYPYVNGGFHGEVVEAGGQVDPQPFASPVRGAGAPLRGAKITGFETTGANAYKLRYEVGGDPRAIVYSGSADGTFLFEYQNGQDGLTQRKYTRPSGGERRPPGGPGASGGPGQSDDRRDDTRGPGEPRREAGGRGGERPEGSPRPPASETPNHSADPNASANTAPAITLTKPVRGFVLTSPEVVDGGALPVDYTGDGTSATLPLQWSGAPAGTKSYALIMHHLDPEGKTKWYWTLYNLPASAQGLPKNVQGVGVLGNNSINDRVGYAPPHSKGPGAKTYVLTLYALSAPPQLTTPPAQVNREVLLAAMKDRLLGTAELHVVYTRNGTASGEDQLGERRGEKDRPVPGVDRPAAGDRAGVPESPGPSDRPSPRADDSAPGGPTAGPGGGARKPWLQMHGAELDADHDGAIALAELTADADRAFAIYDTNQDGTVTAAELQARGDVRAGAAFAGLTFRHSSELDTTGDGNVSHAEFLTAAKYIFVAADLDHDGRVTTAEWQAAPNTPLPIGRGGPPPRPSDPPAGR